MSDVGGKNASFVGMGPARGKGCEIGTNVEKRCVRQFPQNTRPPSVLSEPTKGKLLLLLLLKLQNL